MYVKQAQVEAEKHRIPLRLVLNGNEIDFVDSYGPTGLKQYCDKNKILFYDCINMAKGTLKQSDNIKCFYLDSYNNPIVKVCDRAKWKKTGYIKNIV